MRVDSAERRRRIEQSLHARAREHDGRLVEDEVLLEEVAQLVEWPGVVQGRFDPEHLALPREILITTLRHHQKCFLVETAQGEPLPVFLAVANTDEDPAGHIRRGNEWVVGGRLQDARFFWNDDRRRPLSERSGDLAGVRFHAKAGSYADKASRVERIAGSLAQAIGMDVEQADHCREAARLCKNDLVTGTVGEFPELQGRVGGLMLEQEGASAESAWGIYEHYQPAGADDSIPASATGCVVSVADKLDSVVQLIEAGEKVTGSRDPFGLRRAAAGAFRIVVESAWEMSLKALWRVAGGKNESLQFLHDRLVNFFRDSGATTNEVFAVLRPKISQTEWHDWPLHDIATRLLSIRTVRDREDFEQLADLTKRVDNILSKGQEAFAQAVATAGDTYLDFSEPQKAAISLWSMIERDDEELARLAADKAYRDVVDLLAAYVAPVETFFRTLETELKLRGDSFETHDEAERAIFSYIEIF